MIKKDQILDGLIKEWNEWEDLPDLPELDENEVANMDFKSEFQIIMNNFKNSNEMYSKTLNFQSRFVLFLFIKDIDLPKLNFLLHDLRDFCIQKENSTVIIRTMNSISLFYPEIDNIISKNSKPSTDKSGTYINFACQNNNLAKEDNFTQKNNLTSNDKSVLNDDFTQKVNDTSNKNTNNYNPSKSQRSFMDKYKYSKYIRPRKKPNNNYLSTENRFQLLAQDKDPYESEKDLYQQVISKKINISDTKDDENHSSKHIENNDKSLKHFIELKKLLNVNNGIINKKLTKDISVKIHQISCQYPNDQIWKEEDEYFQNRKTVPYQHIVYLKTILS